MSASKAYKEVGLRYRKLKDTKFFQITILPNIKKNHIHSRDLRSMQSQQSARCADTRECRWISRYHEGSASIAGVWVRDFWPIRGGGPKKAPKSGKQQQAKVNK